MLRTFSVVASAAIIGVSALAAAPAQAGGRHHGHFGHHGHVKFRVVHPGFLAGDRCFRQKVFVKHHGVRKVLVCR